MQMLTGCQMSSCYDIPSPENELQTAKLYLAEIEGVDEGFSGNWERNQNLTEKNRTWVLDETWESWLVPGGWSYDSLEEQYPKGIRKLGLDEAVLSYRRSKGRSGNKSLWYEATLIWMSDTGSSVHVVDLGGWVIWKEEKMVQEPAVMDDL